MDGAYASQKELIASKATQAKDFANQKGRRKEVVDEIKEGKNKTKSQVRAKVEHLFAVVKRLWGFNKVPYRDPTNIYLSRKKLMAQVRP